MAWAELPFYMPFDLVTITVQTAGHIYLVTSEESKVSLPKGNLQLIKISFPSPLHSQNGTKGIQPPLTHRIFPSRQKTFHFDRRQVHLMCCAWYILRRLARADISVSVTHLLLEAFGSPQLISQELTWLSQQWLRSRCTLRKRRTGQLVTRSEDNELQGHKALVDPMLFGVTSC